MSIKHVAASLLAIAVIILLPHSGLIPNFGYSLVILLFVWLFLRYFGEQFSDIGFRLKAFNLHALLIGTLSGVAIFTVLQLVFFPLLGHFITFEESDADIYSFLKENVWQYLFILVMGWLVGGVYEEIVFHGFMFTRFEKMIPGKFATVTSFIITSIIFGVYHIQLGNAGMINAFLAGMAYLGLALYFKRNLWYATIAHGVYNTLAITGVYMEYL